ncbi:MAG: STAS domain-containing protein [Armatimonadota bacterium]
MRRARIAGCRIDYNVVDDCAVVRPEGACDAKSAEALANLVNSPLIRSKHLILDLSRVEYVETPGYRWILKQLKQLESSGRKLVVVALPHSVERVFKLLRLNESIPLACDAKSAFELIHSENVLGCIR